MSNNINKSGYLAAFIRCALLLSVGAALQLLTGYPDKSFLGHPWGVIMAVNYLYLLILAYYFSERKKWIRNLYDHYSMTASLASMTVACIVLGLVGSHKMYSSWPFVLLLFNLISVLGLRCIDDLVHWRTRRVMPSVIHVAVFVIMAAGLFSSGDKIRLKIIAPVGHPMNAGLTEDGKSHILPFSITLRHFTIDEYPPKLYLMDTATGTLSKEFITLENDRVSQALRNWNIRVLELLDSAGKLPGSDRYVPMDHVGTMPAALVEVTDENGETLTGWVSCGSHIFPPSTLEIDRDNVLVMPRPEAESYISQIMIQDDEGEEFHEVRVNHPASKGPWKIYQVSYDKDRGKWSTISVLECVRDGWYPMIRIVLWIVLAAGVAMAFSAGIKRKKKDKTS